MLSTDVRVRECALYFLPVKTRVPLKFGAQVVDRATCARARVVVEDRRGRIASGWGETPLSVAWVWPSESLSWDERESSLRSRCVELTRSVVKMGKYGHPMELATLFEESSLPHLAELVCRSVFDQAIQDAFGNLHGISSFGALTREYLQPDLAHFLDDDPRFTGLYPADFLRSRQETLPVWHLIGGLDPLEPEDLTGNEPDDGYPVLLRDWIRSDGLRCLKIKLRGNDAAWDYDRIVRVGRMAIEEGCDWLTADFNCTVTDPAYVCEILDRLLAEHPRIFAMTLYIEQPFPYDLEAHRIDVRSVSARKPLFLDESAHDWRFVRLGRELGWSGVALKTCKTLSGALLSLCWARAHGMTLMVQDLTNPMLAQIPHVLLAAHAGTIMGVESNAYAVLPRGERTRTPRASRPVSATRWLIEPQNPRPQRLRLPC
jgi:L-alanine-DL-glutamate epimerase-like enolase superfamily enzyme